MDNTIMEKAKARYKSYRKQFNLLTIISALISLVGMCVPILMHNHYWLILISAAVYLVARRTIAARLYNKFIISPLMHELDPELCRAMLEVAKYATYPSIDHLCVAYFDGDYQTVVDLCANKMANPKCQKFTLFYLVILASTYFELDDTSALRATLDRYDAYLDTRNDAEALREKYTGMQAFRQYANGEIIACREALATELRDAKTDRMLLGKVETSFHYALACYRTGETKTARDSFLFVTKNAPKLHFARAAQQYLDAIEHAGKSPITPTVLTPDPAYEAPSYPVSKAARVFRIITYIALAMVLVSAIGLMLTNL